MLKKNMAMPQKKAAQYCEILSNTRVNGAIYRIDLRSRELAENAGPGQFAMVKCDGSGVGGGNGGGGSGGAYLRRPFCFCDACPEDGVAAFMYEVKGVGTTALARLGAGETLDVLGPLGNGFDVLPGKSAIIGGGIGAFPLLLLAKRLCGVDGGPPDIFLGFRDAGAATLVDELRRLSSRLYVVSDDGSIGEKGLVTGAFRAALDAGGHYERIYACGPQPMYRALKPICEAGGVPAQVSLEQRMGCGIGACLVCACRLAVGRGNDTGALGAFNGAAHGALNGAAHDAHDAHDAHYTRYARVCKDGPVFDIMDVSFD